MNENIRKEILLLLDSVIGILRSEEEHDIAELSELSERIIHTSAVFQDEDSISAALMVYSIYKIFSREGEKKKIYTKITPIIEQARSELRKNNEKGFRKKIKNVFNGIKEIDDRISIYLQELLEKAKIKKGANMYSHGISIARVAQITGASLWELSSYVGATNLPEQNISVSASKRLQYAREIFKK